MADATFLFVVGAGEKAEWLENTIKTQYTTKKVTVSNVERIILGPTKVTKI
jgi:hypothetical protein